MSQSSRAAKLQALIQEVIDSGLSDKAACLVAHQGDVTELHAGKSKPQTEYDLASLTKILCTTYLVAKAVTDGNLKLDEQPWPQWPGIRVEHVLAHNSGLPAWLPVTQIEDALGAKPIRVPGEKTVYSDIGFMALGVLLEQRLGASLDQLYQGHATHFHGDEPINDANCRALGGVAGHAGLFGTANAVYEDALVFLKSLRDPEMPLEKRIKSFAEYKGERPLGFDKPTPGGSTGEALSPRSIGHLGFAGSSLWIDPKPGSIYILLLRRLSDDADTGKALLKIRRTFHQQAVKL